MLRIDASGGSARAASVSDQHLIIASRRLLALQYFTYLWTTWAVSHMAAMALARLSPSLGYVRDDLVE